MRTIPLAKGFLGIALFAVVAGGGGAGSALAALDTVITTATKREGAVQETPVAVSAYNEDFLLKTGVDDIKDVMNLSPSFQASTNSSETQGLVIRIRGIGTQGNNPAFESAVGVFIDGVYRARAGAALSELLDVEQIEVLRGPQGTLFGRNTTAGALNITTRGPEFEWGGYAAVEYANRDRLDLRGSVTGPIVEDKLAFRVSALYRERDGLIDIIDNNVDRNKIGDLENLDRYTLKGQLLFEPSDNVSLRIIADYRKQNEDCCYPVTLENGVAATIINNVLGDTQIDPARPFDRQATVNSPVTQDVEDWGFSAELNIDFDTFTVTSITAYRDFQSFRQLDVDFTNADLINQDRDDGIEIFTQELRVQGNWGDIDWLFGLYFTDETIDLHSTLVHGADYEAFINARLGPLATAILGADYTGLAAALGGVTPGTGWAAGTGAIGDAFTSNNKNFSLFTHNVWNVTEKLDFIVGFRFTWDDKRGVSDINNDPANTPGCSAIQPALQGLPNFTLNDLGIVPGDQRRVKDVLAALGCLGITSPAFNYDLAQNDNEWSGIIGLSYDLTDDILVYANASRGYKAGGVNLDRAGTILSLTGDNTDPNNFLDPRFLPEIAYNYELGFKSAWFDNRLNVNIAAFYMDLKNFQLNTFTGFNFTPENVEDASSTGIELEIAAAPADGLVVQFGVTYIKADYGKNITDLTNILANERGLRNGTTPLPEISPLAGRQLTNAPRWVMTGALTYSFPIGNGGLEMFFHSDFRWSSAFNTGSDLDAVKLQPDYIVVNARVGVGDIDGRWTLEVFAENLFDEDYQQIAFDVPLQANDGFGTFLAPPRFYGVAARVNF